MRQELNPTTAAVVIGIVVVLLCITGYWVWKGPRMVGAADQPPAGTPESAAAARERGRQMTEEFKAMHMRGRQAGGPGR